MATITFTLTVDDETMKARLLEDVALAYSYEDSDQSQTHQEFVAEQFKEWFLGTATAYEKEVAIEIVRTEIPEDIDATVS